MLQPQSDEEIRPVVEELRLLDRLIDVRWNPKAVLKTRGSYSAQGKATPAEYDGLWEVVRYETESLTRDRNYVVLCQVNEPYRDAHGWMMKTSGYGPIGPWLVAYMRRWDSAQARFAKEMDRLREADERAEAADVTNETAANQQALEKVYREHGGGEYWMGRGFGGGAKQTAGEAVQAVQALPSSNKS